MAADLSLLCHFMKKQNKVHNNRLTIINMLCVIIFNDTQNIKHKSKRFGQKRNKILTHNRE